MRADPTNRPGGSATPVRRGLRVFLWTALLILMLDQATKVLIVQILDLKSRGVAEVSPPYLTLRMAWNEGINFGLFGGLGDYMRWILIALAAAITLWLVSWMWNERPTRLVQAAAGLVVGGAIGNVIDRVVYGAVADFLNMSCCGIENPYSFNVADIAIFVGAVGLILFYGDGSKDDIAGRG